MAPGAEADPLYLDRNALGDLQAACRAELDEIDR
jgi:hypothetical protein